MTQKHGTVCWSGSQMTWDHPRWPGIRWANSPGLARHSDIEKRRHGEALGLETFSDSGQWDSQKVIAGHVVLYVLQCEPGEEVRRHSKISWPVVLIFLRYQTSCLISLSYAISVSFCTFASASSFGASFSGGFGCVSRPGPRPAWTAAANSRTWLADALLRLGPQSYSFSPTAWGVLRWQSCCDSAVDDGHVVFIWFPGIMWQLLGIWVSGMPCLQASLSIVDLVSLFQSSFLASCPRATMLGQIPAGYSNLWGVERTAGAQLQLHLPNQNSELCSSAAKRVQDGL